MLSRKLFKLVLLIITMKKENDVYAEAEKLTDYEISQCDKRISDAMEKARPGFTEYYKKKLLEDNIRILKGEPLINIKKEERKLGAYNTLYCMLGIYDIGDVTGVYPSPGGPMIKVDGKLCHLITESEREMRSARIEKLNPNEQKEVEEEFEWAAPFFERDFEEALKRSGLSESEKERLRSYRKSDYK